MFEMAVCAVAVGMTWAIKYHSYQGALNVLIVFLWICWYCWASSKGEVR